MKQNLSRISFVALLVSMLGFFSMPTTAVADTTIGTPISKLPFTVKKPGKYRLLKNLTISEAAVLAAGSAINVPFSVNGPVVIDLNGYTITGPNSDAMNGIPGISGSTATTVRNGSIFGFGNAVIGNVVEDITVREFYNTGISANGFSATIRRCKVFGGGTISPPDGSFFAGISAGRADISDCTVDITRSTDTFFYGIIADGGSTVRRCAVRWVLAGAVGFNAASAYRGNSALVENCMAFGFRHGFDGAGMRVQHCFAADFSDAAFTSVDRGAGNNF